MTFQAPYDVTDLMRVQLAERQMQQEQQQNQQENMQAMTDDIGGAIASLAGSYVQGKQMKAKADAYGEFLGMHGDTIFGEQAGDLLKRYKNMNVQQQIALGDMMMDSYLPYRYKMDYANVMMADRANARSSAAAQSALAATQRQQTAADTAVAAGKRRVGFGMLGANPDVIE